MRMNIVKNVKFLGERAIGLAIIGSLLLNGCGSEEPGEEIVLETRIAPVKYDRNAIVTIMSDDGELNTGIMLEKLGRKYDLKITISGIVTWVDPWIKDWKKMERRGHIELISHSYDHVKMGEEAGLNRSDLEHEITDSINYYKENFLTDQIAFTSPEGVMCEQGYSILNENGIQAVRSTHYGYNTLEPEEGHDELQWYDLHTIGITSEDTLEERNAWIDEAVENRSWLIEMWHNVVEEEVTEEGSFSISYDAADAHLSYVANRQADGDIWIASMVDATKYLVEKEYATMSASCSGSKIMVSLTCDSEKLPSDVYCDPLTVKVVLPEDMTDFTKAASSDRKNQVRILREEDKTYLEFEMVPNGKDVTIKLKK